DARPGCVGVHPTEDRSAAVSSYAGERRQRIGLAHTVGSGAVARPRALRARRGGLHGPYVSRRSTSHLGSPSITRFACDWTSGSCGADGLTPRRRGAEHAKKAAGQRIRRSRFLNVFSAPMRAAVIQIIALRSAACCSSAPHAPLREVVRDTLITRFIITACRP